MSSALAGWPPSLLGDERIERSAPPTTSRRSTGIDYLMGARASSRATRSAHVYFEGDYGENALKGSQVLPAQKRASRSSSRRSRPPTTT